MAAFLLALALIGGAKVLEIHSPKRYKRTEARLAFLAKLNQAQTATQRIGLTLQKEAISAQAIWVRDMATALAQDESVMRNFMYKAGKLGYLTPIVKDRFFLTESIYAYARLIKEMAGEEGKVAVNELRDKLNFGRKLTVQLMEYFDRTGFLRCKGNDHILRDKDTFDL